MGGAREAEARRQVTRHVTGAEGQLVKRRCQSYEGCQGRGWLWDPCDSGSGAQVYCDCPAGQELKLADEKDQPAALTLEGR